VLVAFKRKPGLALAARGERPGLANGIVRGETLGKPFNVSTDPKHSWQALPGARSGSGSRQSG